MTDSTSFGLSDDVPNPHRFRRTISRLGVPYLLATLAAVLSTMVLHELAHTTVGELLGNRMVMSLNGSCPIEGVYGSPWHLAIVALAGPLVTVGQAMVAAVWLRRSGDERIYPFLLVPLLYRGVPYLIAVASPSWLGRQDEAIVAAELGVSPWLGAGLTVATLVVVWVWGSSRSPIDGWTTVTTALIAIGATALLVVAGG
ncbi:hypothetical protein [Haladaptatus sp. NG-SE-30]